MNFFRLIELKKEDPSTIREKIEHSMGEEATVLFLVERGVEPVSIESHKIGEPLLFVLDDQFVTSNQKLKALPINRRPSVARVNAPGDVEKYDVYRSFQRYYLINNGVINYYAIDPKTKQVTLIPELTSQTIDKRYIVTEGSLYKANDELFPPAL